MTESQIKFIITPDEEYNWDYENPVLEKDRIVVTDNKLDPAFNKIKIGDGSSTWTETPYIAQGNGLDVYEVLQPRIVFPTDRTTDISSGFTLIGSPFYTLFQLDHIASQFQISTDRKFQNADIVYDQTTGPETTHTVPEGTLAADTEYCVRLRYQNACHNWSKWSYMTVIVTAPTFNFVSRPTIIKPTQGSIRVSLLPTITTSAFSKVGITGTHVASEFQIATDPDFTNIEYATGRIPSAVTSHDVTTPLTPDTKFYIRARHEGDSTGFSNWAQSVNFQTVAKPNKPLVLAPTEGQTFPTLTPTIKSSDFLIPGNSDAHAFTQYQVAKDTSFNLLVYDSGDSVNLLQETVPNDLPGATDLYVRLRHKGLLTDWSDWSDTVSFQANIPEGSTPIFTSDTTWTVPAGVTKISGIVVPNQTSTTSIGSLLSQEPSDNSGGGRSGHATTTVSIDNKNHIVVSGGQDDNNNNHSILSSVIYLDVNDPDATWKPLPHMPESRQFHAMTTISINNKDYIVVSGGGYGSNLNKLSSVIYLDVNDPSAGWQSFPDMPKVRAIHAMSTVTINGNDHIVISGGADSNILSSVIYLDVTDPDSFGWQSFPNMPTLRHKHAMSTVTINGNDHVVLTGGYDGISSNDILSSVIYLDVTNPNAGWQSFPNMPEVRAIHAMTTTQINGNEHIVVSGGVGNSDRLSSVIVLDIINTNAIWQSFPNMPQKRDRHAMTTAIIAGLNHIVIMGGYIGNNTNTVIYLDVNTPSSPGWKSFITMGSVFISGTTDGVDISGPSLTIPGPAGKDPDGTVYNTSNDLTVVPGTDISITVPTNGAARIVWGPNYSVPDEMPPS